MSFLILNKTKNSHARIGQLSTNRGLINTPAFMPIGTYGPVKTLSPKDLNDVGSQIILGNTYHLYLRPGIELIKKIKGLHNLIGWKKPILTDSGGFQVFSLAKLNKITNDGVFFTSNIDGKKHFLTPQLSMKIQKILGSDIIMSFDQCPAANIETIELNKAIKRTELWTRKCHEYLSLNNVFKESNTHFFPIIQGGTNEKLREISFNSIQKYIKDGIAIGGLAVGEDKNAMFDIISYLNTIIPNSKLRYLMGVGKPEDIIEAVSLGVDLFDCVIPTRNARNGQFFTWFGKINIINSKYKDDLKPISENCKCYTCVTFTRAYIRHLFKINDTLGLRLATLHNVYFYMELMKEIRMQISKDSFFEWSNKIKDLISSKV